MVQNAVYDHTVQWVAYGVQPPTAPKIETTGTNTVVRDALGNALGGIRLAQHEVPLRVNSGTNTGPGFCFLDGSSVPLTDAQLSALYPTTWSYVRQVVATTLANARTGYIPREFMRDPAWYTDIADWINEYVAADRLAPRVASSLLSQLTRAQRLGESGSEIRAAKYVGQFLVLVHHKVKGDAGVRDNLIRQGAALLALLAVADRSERPLHGDSA